jgi:DNA invertase Pin-like site-specific DNA recombinase
LYLRVSDAKQSGASSQLTNTRRLARERGLDVVEEVSDDGRSGDDLTRAGLMQVVATLEREHRKGQAISWVIVDQFDRLSRARSLKTFPLLDRMADLGVRYVATPERTYDLHSELDLTLLQIETGHKNSPFLKAQGRRVLNGMIDAARLGFWTGQKPPLGYKIVYAPGDHGSRKRRSGRLAIDEETGPIVRELFDRYLAGESTRDLTRWLSSRLGRRMHRGTVQSILETSRRAGAGAGSGWRRRGRVSASAPFEAVRTSKHSRERDCSSTSRKADDAGKRPRPDLATLERHPGA